LIEDLLVYSLICGYFIQGSDFIQSVASAIASLGIEPSVSLLAAKTDRNKAEIVRFLLDEALKDVEE
jgi:hypothetical protein